MKIIYKKNHLYKRNNFSEQGQSLVEFIVITPIFFIILSGIISIFYLQNKHYMDFQAKISMNINSFLFDEEERKVADWDESTKGKNESLKSILDKSLNPSLAFNLAKNKKDGVFIDKNLVQYREDQNCSTKNTYSFSAKDHGQFQMSTCANKNGYESRKSHYSFDKVLDKFPLSLFQRESTSVYYPFRELEWENRADLAKNPSREFMLSLEGISFARNYASYIFPVDNSLFNKKCFMEPFQPQCSLRAYDKKINRAAMHGANAQIFECYGEMALKCIPMGPAFPECIAEGLIEIQISTRLGRAARNCPLINTEIGISFNIVKGKALFDSASNIVKEGGMR